MSFSYEIKLFLSDLLENFVRVHMNDKNKFFLFLVFLLFSGMTYAASFNCVQVTRSIDKAICDDSDLSALDEKLAEAYAKEFAVNPEVKEDQRAWLRSLKQCNSDSNNIASCLKPMFVDRIKILDEQALNPSERVASSTAETPSQQKVTSADQTQVPSLSESVRAEKAGSEEGKSSVSSATVATVIAVILIALFMVLKKRKKSFKNYGKQEKTVSQKTANVQTIAPLDESKDPAEDMYQRALELLQAGSLSKAGQLLEEIANKGHLNSQYQLGKLMLNQSSAEGDSQYEAGMAWMKKAASLKHSKALLFLNDLDEPISDSTDEIFSVMSFDDWDKKLSKEGIELDEVANHFGMSLNDIEKWREVGKVPQRAVEFLRSLRAETSEVIAQAEKDFYKNDDRNTHDYLCTDCGWHGNSEDTNYDEASEDKVCPECGSDDFDLGTFPADGSLYSSAECGHCNWVGQEDDCSRNESDELVCPSCGAEDDISLRKLPIPSWFGDDRELILRALTTHGSWLKDIPSNMKGDKELVLAAVRSPHLALQFASDEFKNNKEIVEAAITKWAAEFEYASEQMRDDQELTLIAVSSSGYELQNASERLRNDKNIVLKAVSESGGSLQFASPALQDDSEVVMAAVMSQGSALEYASERLRSDKDLVACAVNQDGDAISFAAPIFKKDKALAKKVVGSSYSAIQYIDDSIIDKELCLLAVTQSGWALEHLPDSFRDDEEIALKAVNDVGVALQYASDRLRADQKIVEAALANNADANEYSMLKRSPEKSKKLATAISAQLNAQLDAIIDSFLNDEESLMEWRNSGGLYKVRPGYAYDKFYLNRITGNYDVSLQGLIHHMMNEEGLYKKFLNSDELNQVEECVLENPEGIWGVANLGSPEGEQTQKILDTIYFNCIKHVGERLRQASLDVTEFISEGYIEVGGADDGDSEEVPTWEGVDKESSGYQMSLLISIINNDTWFPDGSTGSFILDGSVRIASEEESIDDPGIFLENYDEMTLYRLKAYEGISFSDTEAISKILADEGNMLQFAYTFDFSEIVEPCEPLFPYPIVPSRQVWVRYIQFGAGTEAGYRVDLASDLDLSWLSAWIQGIRDRGETVSVA